ncbi:hypothetical protein TKK_0005949 [Trichogramma kaykai]
MVKWFIQIFVGIEFMHIEGLVARIEEAEKNHVVGTVLYMAPEMLDPTKKYNHKVDLWSLGVVFMEIMICFQHKGQRENAVQDLHILKYPVVLQKERP